MSHLQWRCVRRPSCDWPTAGPWGRGWSTGRRSPSQRCSRVGGRCCSDSPSRCCSAGCCPSSWSRSRSRSCRGSSCGGRPQAHVNGRNRHFGRAIKNMASSHLGGFNVARVQWGSLYGLGVHKSNASKEQVRAALCVLCCCLRDSPSLSLPLLLCSSVDTIKMINDCVCADGALPEELPPPLGLRVWIVLLHRPGGEKKSSNKQTNVDGCNDPV